MLKICPICNTQIEDKTVRLKCGQCGNADRTRALFYLYESLSSFTCDFHALIFTEENWLSSKLFRSSVRSVLYGANHLDIQKINSRNDSFSWIACNHILEHVKDYSAAINEMYRVLKNDGVVQITVPMPSAVFSTTDWGFADPNKMGHYRNFGADFSLFLSSLLKDSFGMATVTYDKLSSYKDVVYFLFKDKSVMESLATGLFRNGYISVPFCGS